MDGISRSRGWDKEIPHGVLPIEQLVLSDKWARNNHIITRSQIRERMVRLFSENPKHMFKLKGSQKIITMLSS